jgi:hypothetical protein
MEVDNSEEQRNSLKEDLNDSNNKIISLEEELYESKTIQLELLENLKLTEEKLQTVAAENDDIHK